MLTQLRVFDTDWCRPSSFLSLHHFYQPETSIFNWEKKKKTRRPYGRFVGGDGSIKNDIRVSPYLGVYQSSQLHTQVAHFFASLSNIAQQLHTWLSKAT
jgi:hypothetical protein